VFIVDHAAFNAQTAPRVNIIGGSSDNSSGGGKPRAAPAGPPRWMFDEAPQGGAATLELAKTPTYADDVAVAFRGSGQVLDQGVADHRGLGVHGDVG
jgi:hypothetical protein